MRIKTIVCLMCCLAAGAAKLTAAAESGSKRWETEIRAFEAADRAHPPPRGAVLFVGSSTIRFWKTLAQDLPEYEVLNRGFGGCHIADCTYYADRIVIPYQPRLIVLRAGGNDIAAGKTPERVRDDFRAFVEKVRAKLPEVRIAYMTINATPARWANVQREKKANKLIKEYIAHGANLDYIDTFDATMANGRPREELFVIDRLHFNAEGYKILASCVRSHLARTSADHAGTETAAAPVSQARTEANRMVEISFTASRDYRDAFHDVAVDVAFETPQGHVLKVPAFWAEGRVWKVRYASPELGTHRWRSTCSAPADGGLHGVAGTVTVETYPGDNPLYRHGPLRVAADRRHFEHVDGTPFFWLADTWWMGLCQRLHWPQDFQQLAADRKAKGFNVVQIVAGLYPDMPAFDPRGANEAGFPWEKDYARIRPEYFDKADQRLIYLADQGFVPCIVGAWGYHLPWLGTDRMKEHWRYVIARTRHCPWSGAAAGEGTMPFYGSPHAREDAALQKEGWSQVIRYIRATDPFHHMITIHPSRSARETVTDPAILNFDMHQTGHSAESDIGRMAQQMSAAYTAQPAMPVIAGESSYDGLDLREFGGGVLSSDASRQMFWAGLMQNGAAGGTYGANGIWQVNRREQPYGPSPHGRSWGSIPWDEAMKRAGSAQVGLAKQFFARYPWFHLEPRPAAAAWADNVPVKDGIVPWALGTEAKLLIVYVPRPRPVVVAKLPPQTHYAATLFDPVAGGYTNLGKIKTAANGSWTCPAPALKHDWVLVLEKQKAAGEP